MVILHGKNELDNLYLKHLHGNGAIRRWRTHFIHYLDLLSVVDENLRPTAFADCIWSNKNTISSLSK